MGKISDIWVRLGLKKNEFDKGMDDAIKKTEKTGSKMSQMLTSVKAGWAAVGATIIAFGQQMISATNKVGDAWNNTIAGVQAGWQQMLANISNMEKMDFAKMFTQGWVGIGKFWKKAFKGTKEAAEAGVEMSKAFDAEFELENSLKIQRAKISGELADLQVEMRNTALSPEQRKAATERYRALLEPLYKAEIETRKNMLDEAVEAWLAGSGVTATTQEVADFFANYGIDPEGAAAANPELKRIYEERKGDKANQPIFDAITKLALAEGGLANELKLVNRTANIIDKAIADGQIDIKALGASLLDDFADDLDIEDALDVDRKVPEIDKSSLDKYEKDVDDFIANWQEQQAQISQLNGMLEDSLISSMSNGLQAITDMMMGVKDADAKAVLAAFIAPFGDMAKNMGAMIMSYGISMEAFKKAFTNPYVAIAAGAGLMAIGAAISSGAQKLSQGSLSGGASTAYTGGSPSGADVASYESTLTVEVVGKISGSDILLAGQKTQNKWNR